MAGKTGYTTLNSGLSPDGPTQINDIASHFDDLIDQVVATSSAAPASGNWIGRRVIAADTKIVYRNMDGANNWKPWDSEVIVVSSGVPVVPGSGAFTSYTSVLRWKYVGGLIFFQYTLTITDVGTATGPATVTFPFTNGPMDAPVYGYESLVTASQLSGAVGANGNTASIYTAVGGSPLANGRKLNVRGWVEPA